MIHEKWPISAGATLIEAKVEPIPKVVRSRMFGWNGLIKLREEIGNIRIYAEMKMAGKQHRGRPRVRRRGTLRKDMKACIWHIYCEYIIILYSLQP